jgi:23S rRNA (adenine-N6)-dimethyltransferase
MARRRSRLAQNFLVNRAAARAILSAAQLTGCDTVYEIGPGRGALTRELARVCGRLVAVEIDPRMVARLESRLGHRPNVELRCEDFLDTRIDARDYKVVASIPFNATADIMRKLFWRPNPPVSAVLVVQREAALKYVGLPHSTVASASMAPWHRARVVGRLHRSDFDPVPHVDSVTMKIVRRAPPLLPPRHARAYRRFVRYGFEAGVGSARENLRRVFTYRQWRRLARALGFGLHANPRDLTGGQWAGLFGFLISDVGRSRVTAPAPSHPPRCARSRASSRGHRQSLTPRTRGA